MPKNFDQSESWKIEFHCRHQHYIPFKSACSTEFKNVLGSKISENDDFLRKKILKCSNQLKQTFHSVFDYQKNALMTFNFLLF